MKKNLVIITLLLLGYTSWAQTTFSVRMYSGGKKCDTCYIDGIFNRAEVLKYAIVGATEEFMHNADTAYKIAARGLQNVSKYFISSSSFSIDFLPTRTGEDQQLPVYPHEGDIVNYRELEFQVLQNNVLLRDWKDVSSLQPDKEYLITYSYEDPEDFKEWPSLLAGKFNLDITDKLLVKIRKKNTDKILQHIYVERLKVFPDITSIAQFPSGTGIQDILNKEITRRNSWLLNGDELEIKPGNSVLIGFDRGLNGKLIVEYAFSDNPDKWQSLENVKDGLPTISPYFLFIDKAEIGKITGVFLRYRHQSESVLHIKLIVKPKLTQTTWFRIAASLVLAFLLFTIGYYFNRRKNKKQLQQLLFKKKELENKLQLLSGQLNPHFLFNSLNSIQNLVNKEDMENASGYLALVSSFLRTVMDAGKKEYISLQEELSIASSYLQLEQKRKAFRYSIEDTSQTVLSQIDFPPLLLQPVLENCIHHGFIRETNNPFLRIEITRHGNNITVGISDNGKGFDPVLAERGQGLSLIEKRIALMNEKLNSDVIEMKIASGTNKGTITTLTLKNWL